MTDSADLVVIGGGTIGGWASYFAASSNARVVVLERGRVGSGASSRAAGIVRAQGGTPATVALGRWSIDFYRSQPDLFGFDSGFRELGYMLLAATERDVEDARSRIEMQRAEDLDVRWLEPQAAALEAPTLSPHGHHGATYVATDGAIDPPRNVLAYSLAMKGAGVDVREGTPMTGLVTSSGSSPKVIGVETPDGVVSTERVLLTGGPSLRSVGRLAGIPIPVGGARHQVAVTEPHAEFAVDRAPMIFDLRAGLYWRLEEGGLLFGMSNPNEPPGEARSIDWDYMAKMRERLAELVPVTRDLELRKIWAATIDYTPDHLPILGPAVSYRGSTEGVTIAAAGGHGMMWGPAVARIAADLALEGTTSVTDVSNLGLDRFDEGGRSRLEADPIALPFPVTAD